MAAAQELPSSVESIGWAVGLYKLPAYSQPLIALHKGLAQRHSNCWAIKSAHTDAQLPHPTPLRFQVVDNAARLNIKVISMSLGSGSSGSLGGETCSNTNNFERRAICRAVAAGITVVAAAGNAAEDLIFSEPAIFPEVLTVTAMSDNDGAAGGERRCTN